MRDGVDARHVGIVLVVLSSVTVAYPMKTAARDRFSGRFYVTYQNSERASQRREYLSERFEATLRDRVFERNDLDLTFYFDNARDLYTHQTIRRYRGMLNLQNPYYTFNARYTPRQEITPLELPTAIEILDQQLLLDVHVPNAPRVRLSYGETERFIEGATGNRTTDLRGDVSYAYKIFSAMLNRYRSTSENSRERKTTVTGADLRAGKSFGPQLTFDAGYQYQLSEVRPSPGLPSDITNQSLNAVVRSVYRRTVQGTLTFNRRYLTNEANVTFKSTDDNDLLSLLFLPFSPVNVELTDTFVRSRQDTLLTQTHYASAQFLADGKIRSQLKGRLQLTRRMDIDTIDGIVPDHLYIGRLESFDRRGITLRGELGVSERAQGDARRTHYTNSSLLDIYLRPWKNLTLVPRVRYTKFSDAISFTRNDQAAYTLTGTWTARWVNFGMNLDHSVVTTGRQSVSNGATFTFSANLRSRSSVSLSYGERETDRFATETLREEYDKSRTMNVWAQVWVLPRGSLSANYTQVERERQSDSNYLAVSYRQEF